MKKLSETISECITKGGTVHALADSGGNVINYEDLGTAIKEYASKIRSCLAGNLHNIIGVISERDILVPVFLYSIIYSGNAYLPIDYRFPSERVNAILESATPKAVIIQDKFLAAFRTDNAGIINNIVAFADGFSLVLLNFNTNHFPADTIYVLYTSGSTGKPKGVIHTDKSVTAFLDWCDKTIDTGSNGNFIWISPLHFDLSVFDIFLPIFRSGCLLVVKEDEVGNQRMLSNIIAGNGVDHIYATPSFFQLLCDGGKLNQYDFSKVKCVLIAGEQLHWALLRKLQSYFPNVVFYNLYGPTETNVCLFYKVDFNDEQKYTYAVPIGKVCSGDGMLLRAYDEPGLFELLVTGDTLMHGYAGGEQARFEVIDGKRYYNTGDIVRQVFDDNLAFSFRADRMIKKNGYRIEPAEIEKYLKQLNGVKNAIVLAIKLKENTKLVVFAQSEVKYSLLEIKQYCMNKLPYYMSPDDIVYLDELPLNLNNKTDTQRLINNYAG